LKRLMKSFGYLAATYPSAGDFLKSPQLEETSCLITDVHMSGMTGVELYEYLIKAGRAIPTNLGKETCSNVRRIELLPPR
jgi:FixJ family two-component response regulator